MPQELLDAITRFETYMTAAHRQYDDGFSWARRLWETGCVFCLLALVGMFGIWLLVEIIEVSVEEIVRSLTLDNLVL